MRPSPSLRLALPLLLLLCACANAASKPDIRRNPQPRSIYEVTATIKGAPGRFDRIEGWMDYRVANASCVPLTPITGATVAPEWREAVDLKAVGTNVYKGRIAADLLANENYYGLGVCRWDVVAASVVLAVNGVQFTMPLFNADLTHGRAITRYYSNRSYATTKLDRVDLGEPDRTQYGNEADATFSITVQARALKP